MTAISSWAQSSGTITGVVKDATGGVCTNASVEISDLVSGYHRETTTGIAGDFRFTNLPFNTYHLVVKADRIFILHAGRRRSLQRSRRS